MRAADRALSNVESLGGAEGQAALRRMYESMQARAPHVSAARTLALPSTSCCPLPRRPCVLGGQHVARVP